MKLLASLSKKTPAPRYSDGVLRRFSMFCLGHSVRLSGYVVKSASTMSVTMYPGEMVLTRMLCWPHSAARLRAIWITPAFEVLYALVKLVSDTVTRGWRCWAGGVG